MASDRPSIGDIIGSALEAREELVQRGLSWLEADVITGCALGVMLAGGGR